MADGIQAPWFAAYISRPLSRGQEIPQLFLSEHREMIGENALLVARDGDAFVVKVTRSGQKTKLTELNELTRKFSIRRGDTIMFRLAAFSLFLIHVFDEAGFEVVGPRAPAN